MLLECTGMQAYLDMVGERAGSERRSSGRGAHSRQRLFEDSSGRAVDVYLLDEHFHRSAVPCPALASACALSENTHTVRYSTFQARFTVISFCLQWGVTSIFLPLGSETFS